MHQVKKMLHKIVERETGCDDPTEVQLFVALCEFGLKPNAIQLKYKIPAFIVRNAGIQRQSPIRIHTTSIMFYYTIAIDGIEFSVSGDNEGITRNTEKRKDETPASIEDVVNTIGVNYICNILTEELMKRY